MIHPYNTPEPHEPSQGQRQMAASVNHLVQRMLRGEMVGLAICGIDTDGHEPVFYINSSEEDVLRGPMEAMRVMYETSRFMGRMDTSPMNNRSYRSH